ncbi:hypothetical protein [Flavobacterium capsici]|uniref:Signal peptidase n=1 Tax=Flavobacterium capsici TaxID=3075618 RepID=A0AA96J3P1_9FLAO|nr:MULTISPECIES: hypothetical protein [unclassified Flavobacterium]WNM19573.1 hypothetical protein RN608_02550 [Flavobacterium sp. PMR2A8]WNM20962.1 hypothetical protein RN605_09720 [Flavobacterium sp. PMTSA4]
MKIVPNRISILLAMVLLLSNIGFAAPEPPPPSTPPPPPGLPIDGSIVVLVVVSILFGIYKVYKNQYIKKASN